MEALNHFLTDQRFVPRITNLQNLTLQQMTYCIRKNL